MVAKIITGKSIRGALKYNENKVNEGQARLIMASSFAGDIEKMNFGNKVQRFEKLTMLNPKVKTNTMHISLNFDSAEKLEDGKLQQIAAAYMEKIGFGDQPFLVYRHHDAAHHHVHIVTTNMQRDGKRIDLHNIGRLKSEPARKAIEHEFQLTWAESKQYKMLPGIKPADPEKARYGHIPTKRAVGNVVTAVMNDYLFTSLAEYNAVLKQFNVIADRGKEDTVMFQKKGLIYSLLDEKGNQTGIPIKASSFHNKPTLANLEKKFEQNLEKRKPYKEDLKECIEQVFSKYSGITKSTLITELQKNQVNVLFRQNDQGITYGVTFIDNRNKTVFNGSDLGKPYSAKGLNERFSHTDQLLKPEIKSYLRSQHKQTSYLKPKGKTPAKTYLKPPEATHYLKGLLGKTMPDHAPVIPKRKKRRKRQGMSL